jgi:hypothetical protein
VFAGLLLVLGGGLIALGSQRDWLTAHLAGNESATLNVASARFSIVMLIFAGLIIVLGFVRFSRGFSKDVSLHQIAALASAAAVVAALVRTGLFLADHNLALSSTSTYGHLSIGLGVYLMAAGVAATFLSRFA